MIAGINMSFEQSNLAVQEYKKELQKLQSGLRDRFMVQLAQDFYALRSAFPNLEKLFILGHTPEWNDGEECVHESQIYFENKENERWDDMGEYVDRIYYDADVVPEEFLTVNIRLTSEEVSSIRTILRTAKLESNLSAVFETNFQIIVDLTEEDIKITVDDYECGY